MKHVSKDILLLIAKRLCGSYRAADWALATREIGKMCMVCPRWNAILKKDGASSEKGHIWFGLHVTRALCDKKTENKPCLHPSFRLSSATKFFSLQYGSWHLPIECYNAYCHDPIHYEHVNGVKTRVYSDYRIPMMKRAISHFTKQYNFTAGEWKILSRWRNIKSRKKKVANFDPAPGKALAKKNAYRVLLNSCLKALGGSTDTGYKMRERVDLDELRRAAIEEAPKTCPMPQLRDDLLQNASLVDVFSRIRRLFNGVAPQINHDEMMTLWNVYAVKVRENKGYQPADLIAFVSQNHHLFRSRWGGPIGYGFLRHNELIDRL